VDGWSIRIWQFFQPTHFKGNFAMQRKWILAMALTLLCAAGAHASLVTTQVTLQAPFGGASNVAALVNGNGGLGAGLSYTVSSSSAVGTPVYATGADLLGSYKLFNGTTNSFQNVNLVLTFAIQGAQISPVGGAAFSAQFTKGVFGIYSVPSFNAQNATTWGPTTAGSTLLYSATLSPVAATAKGTLGDQGFVGQPTVGQNQASFFVSSATQSLGAFLLGTLNNPGTLFAPPQPFIGFQGEISEVNALAPTQKYPTSGFPTNAQLDANFSALAALSPGTGLSTGQFTTQNYTGHATGSGPSTLQEISFTGYPINTVIPEPASILLFSFGGAIGLGFYTRRQKKLLVSA
jgi:hypothetical protein